MDPLRLIPVVGNPLADLLPPDMTVLVNLGYGSIADGWSQGPANVSTPFDLFPTDLNWSDVLTALVNGVPQGIEAPSPIWRIRTTTKSRRCWTIRR